MIPTLKYHVKNILKWYPYTRNSDIYLWTELINRYYWKEFITFAESINRVDDQGVQKTLLTNFMMEVPNQDNVKRIRAYYQNDKKKYIPTNWSVAMKRGWKENDWKVALGYSVKRPADHIDKYNDQQHLLDIESKKNKKPTGPNPYPDN